MARKYRNNAAKRKAAKMRMLMSILDGCKTIKDIYNVDVEVFRRLHDAIGFPLEASPVNAPGEYDLIEGVYTDHTEFNQVTEEFDIVREYIGLPHYIKLPYE